VVSLLYSKVEKENGKLKRTILETLSLSMYFLQQNRMKVVLLVGADRDCAESDTTFKVLLLGF